MALYCPNCRESVDAPAEGKAVCPKCEAPLMESPDNSAEIRKADLLDDVLRDVRAAVRYEEQTVKSRPTDVESPGIFLKPEAVARERRRPRLRHSALIALGIFLVLGVAYLAFYMIQRGIAENRAENVIARTTSFLPAMRSNLSAAKEAQSNKNFSLAAKSYVDALESAERARVALLSAPVNPDRANRERLAELQDEVLRTVRECEAALASPDLKYGGMGLVEFDGQWVTQEERDRLQAERMISEGRTLYEGEWLTEAEIHERKGEVLYLGEWISKEEYAKRVATDEAPVMAPPSAPAPAPLSTRGQPGFEVSAQTWVLDDFEKQTLDWTNVTNWTNANPAKLSIVDMNGSNQMLISMEQGNNDKVGLVRRVAMDWRSRSKLRMDINNMTGEPVKIAIAIETNRYFESRWKNVTMGINKDVTFDLKSSDFKSAPNWTHMQTISNLNATRWLYLIIYHNRTSEIYVDNIQLLGGE